MDLLPVEALGPIGRVLAFGAAKYEDDGWRNLPNGRRRYYAAALRHLFAWWGGEANDSESNLPHLAHAACCLLYLLTFDAVPNDTVQK